GPSFSVTGYEPERSNSGGFGDPAVAHTPCTIRSTAASTHSRTVWTNARILISITASTAMMLLAVPTCSEPTVTTADSVAEISRETIVCSLSTTDAASTAGSTVVSGR